MYKSKEELDQLLIDYRLGSIAPTEKEGLIINPKVAYEVKNKDIAKSVPSKEVLKRLQPVYGKLSDFSTEYTPVDNLLWDYLYFTDSSIFRPAGLAFMKSLRSAKGNKGMNPCYTSHLPGTNAHERFWDQEFRRITQGYEPEVDGKPCGIRISGEFYFYINYGWIKKLDFNDKGEVISDESGIADFLVMDYYYYKELESREDPAKFGLPYDHKQSMSITKSRRKGFSYKAGSGAAWIISFKPKSKVLIASDTGKDAALCFKKAMDIIDHLSLYTPFGRKNVGNTAKNGNWKHMNMSQTPTYGKFVYGLENTKTRMKKGRQSEIVTASLNQKPDAASGEGLNRLYFEEAGKTRNLSDAWVFSLESLRVGSVYRSGIAIVFGTGGSMISDSGNKGSSHDFAQMHERPESVGIAAYDNIYEYKRTQRKCGYFVADMWANFGSKIIIDGETYLGLDKNGNAIFWIAELVLNKDRAQRRPPIGKKKAYDKYLTQRCKTPSEAFLITTGNRFQSEDLVERKTQIAMSKGGFESLRMPGELVEHDGKIKFIPKPNEEPLLDTFNEGEREGCFLQYEPPQKVDGRILDGSYIISVDPIGINTDEGGSLSAIIVYKTNKYESWIGKEKIVGVYLGRKRLNPQEYVQQLLLKLSKYYNAMVTVENDRDGGIPPYFIKKGEAARLMGPPVITMEKIIPGSKTSKRPYGHSMASTSHKQTGEDLLYEWLGKRGSNTTYYDTEDGEQTIEEGLQNMYRLEDLVLINQLINYTRGGNYDLVMAMMGIVIQLKEWFTEEAESIDGDSKDISSQLKDWLSEEYK